MEVFLFYVVHITWSNILIIYIFRTKRRFKTSKELPLGTKTPAVIKGDYIDFPLYEKIIGSCTIGIVVLAAYFGLNTLEKVKMYI